MATVNASWQGAKPYSKPLGVVLGWWWQIDARPIAPTGVASFRHGTPFVTQQQFISVSGIDELVVGSPLFTRDGEYVPPWRVVNANWQGAQPYEPSLDGVINVRWGDSGPRPEQYVYVDGFESHLFGHPAAVYPQAISVPSIPSSLEFGTPELGVYVILDASWEGRSPYNPPHIIVNGWWHTPQQHYVFPAGLVHTRFGGTSLRLGQHVVRTHGEDESGFGQHHLELHRRDLRPSGFSHTTVGQPSIINRNRYISAGIGRASSVFGEHEIWNRDQYITFDPKKPVAAYESGAHEVSAGIRYLLPTTIISAAYGRPWLSFSPRTLDVTGIPEVGMPKPLVGGLQFVVPNGWDSQAFGERIIPEVQFIGPFGFADDEGIPSVWHNPRVLAPRPFQRNEELRFGSHLVYNLVQYIQHEYLDDADLNGEKWGDWTKIENRNKVILTHASPPPPLGHAVVLNAAVPLYPAGLTQTQPGRPDVSHGVRHLAPEGLDSLWSSRWHTVYNDATLVSMYGAQQSVFGAHSVVNTRRYYDLKGWESAELGEAFVAYRIRTVTVETRYSIEPPPLPLPEVKLHTRYVAPPSISAMAVPAPTLNHHRTMFAPEGWHATQYGWHALRKLTPEIPQRGWNSEEFGNQFVRTQWRTVHPHENHPMVFGRPTIADTRRTIRITAGTHSLAMTDRHKVTKTGQDEGNYEQVIHVNSQQPPNGMLTVPDPSVMGRSLFPEGEDTSVFGPLVVHANSIRVEPGIWEHKFGTPSVSGPNVIYVESFGVIDNNEEAKRFGKPDMSPRTIWCTTDVTQQAVRNHKGLWEVIGSEREDAKLGRPRVEHQHRVIDHERQWMAKLEMTKYGFPALYLSKQYVEMQGLNSQRIGFPTVDGGVRHIELFDSHESHAFGTHTVRSPGAWVRYIRPIGLREVWGEQRVELLHREVSPKAFDALVVPATSGNSNTRYVYHPNTLHVGPPMPTIPEGYDANEFGEDTWVSHWVREVFPQGDDHQLVNEYDIMYFQQRMRVTRTELPRPVSSHPLEGFDSLRTGTPDVRPGVYFIRPDGNADQYYKGGLQE